MGIITQNGNVEVLSFMKIKEKIAESFDTLGIKINKDDKAKIYAFLREGTFDRYENITENALSKEIDDFIESIVATKINELSKWINDRKKC